MRKRIQKNGAARKIFGPSYFDLALGTLTTVIYSKLYKIDILTWLPFINEETRIFQKLSLLGPAEVGSPVYVKSTIYMV